jgi:hypothetical protein
MNPLTEDRFGRNTGALAAEDTLRLIANLPAPNGLEDRVKAGLRSAPRRGMVVAWPFSATENWMYSSGVKAAAAAAIVLAIAGGGWGVYSHIRVAPVPSALIHPPLPNGAGRFSTAGAVHVPQTVQGPVIAAPVLERQKQEAWKASQIPQQHAAKKKPGAHTDAPTSASQPRVK